MFKITKDGATVAMTEAPNYIKQAENGCFVLCPEAEATGIAHNGTVYHLLGRPDMAGAEITVMLEETDAGTSRHTVRVCWRCTDPLTKPIQAHRRIRSRGCMEWTAPPTCITPITASCICAKPT